MFEEYMRIENKNVKVILEVENIETLFELSCKGMGIAVYPEMFLRRHRDVLNSSVSPVTVIPLGDKFSESVLYVAYHKKKYLSRAAKEFIATAKEQYR